MESKLHIKRGNRIFLNGREIQRVTKVSIIMDACADPVAELQISVDKIIIDGYTNGINDLALDSQSRT